MSHTQVNANPTPVPAVLNLPNPEVVVKAQRRRFTAEYKRRILQEADACTHPGEVGAVLRREGLYSSHLSTWRYQRAQGALQGLMPAKRGRQANPQAAENARLQRETERLKAQLARAELIIEVQKKVSQLLGLPEMPRNEVK
jgi:transposase-like protein